MIDARWTLWFLIYLLVPIRLYLIFYEYYWILVKYLHSLAFSQAQNWYEYFQNASNWCPPYTAPQVVYIPPCDNGSWYGYEGDPSSLSYVANGYLYPAQCIPPEQGFTGTSHDIAAVPPEMLQNFNYCPLWYQSLYPYGFVCCTDVPHNPCQAPPVSPSQTPKVLSVEDWGKIDFTSSVSRSREWTVAESVPTEETCSADPWSSDRSSLDSDYEDMVDFTRKIETDEKL